MTASEMADIILSKYDPAMETPLELCDRLFKHEKAQAVVDAMHLCLSRVRKRNEPPSRT